ncbi:MAG: beta-agarase [Verrucomicrobiota bacterium]
MRLFTLFALIPTLLVGQDELVEIQLAPDYIRDIGGVTEFDRNQFITVHENFGSRSLTKEERVYLGNELDARYGRDGGNLSGTAKGIRASADNPDMPDVEQMAEQGKRQREHLSGFPAATTEHMRELVICTHPELMHAMPDNDHAAWGPRTYEGVAEFTAQFLKHYYDHDQRPKYIEVFNEPFVKAKKIGTDVQRLSEQHNVVAKRVRELNPDVMVGGYSAAWVEVEARNFDHWNNWQKTFMDIAGENMDFFSYHVYDGVNVEGTPRDRTGSNSEAIMDLIDTYSHIKFGVAKPLMITEYGKIPEGNMGMMDYSPARSGGMLYSINGQNMTYMDHPDRLLKTIPFVLGKALWTYSLKGTGEPGQANPFLLWRRTAEGNFVTTDLMLFYEFWKGVEGQWRVSQSSNPDVRVHLLNDGNRLWVILANLAHENMLLELSGLEDLEPVAITARVLTTNGEQPRVGEMVLPEIPHQMNLLPGMGAMIIVDLPEPVGIRGRVAEHRVYATDYLKDINSGEPIEFTFVDTPTGAGGAILRLSPGRELGKQVLPDSIEFNGYDLQIPDNWAGDDQAGRANFFGMIEVPVPMEYVREENTVEIIYPDTGGKVACVVLQVNLIEQS